MITRWDWAVTAGALGLALAGFLALGLLALVKFSPLSALPQKPLAEQSAGHVSVEVAGASKQRVGAAYPKLPLSFVPNAGQTDLRVRYFAQGPGYGLYFTPEEAIFAFVERPPASKGLETLPVSLRATPLPDAGKPTRGVALALRFLGANPEVRLEGRREGTGKVNYLIGNNPANWRTGLPTYQEVVYRELWPGVDLVFRGEGGRLKYEFVLQPGARVESIRLAYRGAEDLSLDEAGNLRIKTPLGMLIDERPQSYQEIGGNPVPLHSRFVVERQANGESVYGFRVGEGYDPRHPLIIDPGYSTYLGGSSYDAGYAIAVDSAGYAYVAGFTNSTDFPTVGAFDVSSNGDAFVTKLDPTGSALVYSTYLGGSSYGDYASGIAVDSSGQAYVTGYTLSSDFPTTDGAFDRSHNGGNPGYDAFVAKLTAAGNGLLYSTYLGGRDDDVGRRIAVDSGGHAYVTGYTSSPNFPTTKGAFARTNKGGRDAFVTKLDPTGSALVYSTYLGGSSDDFGLDIAVDSFGHAYVTGGTASTNFPTTAGAFDTICGTDGQCKAGRFNVYDAFGTKLNPTGSALVYSTYLGGSSSEYGFGIAVDSAGHAYVTGATVSPDFPTTAGVFDTTCGTDGKCNRFSPFSSSLPDAFVTKLDPTGSALVYSTYLGGSGEEYGLGIAVDSSGYAYVTGYTTSSDFPTTAGAFDASYNGSDDAFVTKLDPTGSALVYSTYLGGSDEEYGLGIAVDSAGHAYVTGYTRSTNFPTTVGAFDTALGGFVDAFVAKLEP